MKTFETEKHNIPEGATHYRDECKDFTFVWVKQIAGKEYVWDADSWYEAVVINRELEIKPIPQANIETPEEKEALDSIDSNLIKLREMTQPRFSKCETVFSFSHGDRRFILMGIDTDHPQLEVVRHETEAERVEREREESAKDLYITYMSKWEFSQDWEVLDEINKSAFLAIVDKTNYRKESE